MRPLIRFALVLVASVPGFSTAALAEWSAYSTARVDALVERFRTTSTPRSMPWVPSLSMAVGINGNLALARGYGEARPGYLANEHTVYHIGSLTKQFTAAAMLGLIESGVLAPISRTPITLSSHLRDFFNGVENWVAADTPQITVRGLLTMTSGLPSLTDKPPLGADPWGTITARQMLDELKKLSASEHNFEYSNSSYFLVAQAIEDASGPAIPDYRTYLRTAVLDKIGLRDTGFIGDYAPGTSLAVATPSWGPDTPTSRKRPAYVEADWLKGSADMASSAFDLFSWNKALMEGEIVSRSSRALMLSDAARAGRSRYYGMGWFIDHVEGADVFSHTGYVPGYSSLNMIVKLRRGSWVSVSLLINADGVTSLEKLAADIVQVALH